MSSGAAGSSSVKMIGMLHMRLRVPDRLRDTVMKTLIDDSTVTNVAVVEGAYVRPPGALILADVARESAQALLASLRKMGLAHEGAIALNEGETIMSDAATAAEQAAPGTPVDGVVWDLIEDRTRTDIRLSWSFVAFLTLATLIAGVGRLLDQPILIVGAMVVGPEFSAIAAICFALARPRLSLLPPAALTLLGGMAIAVAIATALGVVVHAAGGFDDDQLAHAPLTDFIVHPDAWSFVVAVLAGIAGVLSLTTSKSSTLVGVFISVTTVPALGSLALSIATGNGNDAGQSLIQLGVNIAGLVIAGTATLAIQKTVWMRISRGRLAPS
jgi:uncharacterized hydrophobic protein (TIGR00271 family)